MITNPPAASFELIQGLGTEFKSSELEEILDVLFAGTQDPDTCSPAVLALIEAVRFLIHQN